MSWGKLTCWAVENLADVHAEGRLAEGQARWVDRHLDACASCAEAVRGARSLRSLLRSSGPVRAPEGLAAAIEAALRKEPGAALPARDAAPLGAQAAVLLYLSALVVAVQALPGVPSQARPSASEARPWEVR